MSHLDARGDVEPEFARMVGGLAEAFGQTVTAMRIKLYAKALEDLPLADVRAACARALRECRFFPSAAELRGHVEPSVDDAALLAWVGFQRAAGRLGSYNSVAVDDGAAASALVSVFGGWPEYCALTDVAVAAQRQAFMAAYRAARRGGTAPALLPGTLEPSSWMATYRLDAQGKVSLLEGQAYGQIGTGEAREAEHGDGAAQAGGGEGEGGGEG